MVQRKCPARGRAAEFILYRVSRGWGAIIPLTNPRLASDTSQTVKPPAWEAGGESMHVHRYLPCVNGCLGKIYIPVPILPEKSRSQIPWPPDVQEQTFVCPVCSRATVYTKPNLLLDLAPSPGGPDLCTETEVFLISVPCGIDKCAGLVEIHAVMPKDSSIENAANLAPRIYADSIPCTKGIHTHTGRCVGVSSIGFAVDLKWGAL